MKKYQIIYADPPWRYKNQNTYPEKKIFENEHFYPTMTLEEIKQMRLPIDDDAWLILWATAKILPECLEVLFAWGFDYRISAVWDKGNGLGYFFRVYHEILLIGKKGNPKNPTHSVPSIFKSPRGRHSQKPDCVSDWIDECFPDTNKLELFARRKRLGWDCWGNEVESDIEL